MYLLQEDTPPLVILHCSPSAIHSGLCKVMLNCCMNSELSGGWRGERGETGFHLDADLKEMHSLHI